jgi:hypothetical protein
MRSYIICTHHQILLGLKSRKTRWVGCVVHIRKTRNAYEILVGKSVGTRPSRRYRCRWEDNIKMDLSIWTE